MISKKGFTLFEILLVITIMAIISIAALTSSINTQRQFVFINTFKELLAKVREPRLYNVTQKSVELSPTIEGEELGLPSAYGIYINKVGTKIVISVFADLAASGTQNKYDEVETIGNKYSLDATKYTLVLRDSDHLAPADPLATLSNGDTLTLLYPPGEIKVNAFYATAGQPNTLIPITNPSIYLELKDNKLGLTKNISVFLRSGIAEEYTVPQLAI